jgi:hypothetical protein
MRECTATGRTGVVGVGTERLVAIHIRLLPDVGPMCWAPKEILPDAGASVAPASIPVLEGFGHPTIP